MLNTTFSSANFTISVNHSSQPLIVSKISWNGIHNWRLPGKQSTTLAQTYEKLGDAEWAKDWLVNLVQNHQSHPTYERGMQMLAQIQQNHPDLEVPNMDATLPEPLKVAKLQPDLSLLQTHFLPPTSPPKTKVPNIATDSTACSIGSWCESSPQVPMNSSTNKTCRPGQWC